MARERFTGTFDADDLEWLGEEADRRGISIAELLRRLVKDARDRSESETTLEDRVEAIEAEVFGSSAEVETPTTREESDLRQRIRHLDFPEFRLEDDRLDVLVEIVETLRERNAMGKDEVLEIIENAEMQSVSSVQSFYDHGARRLGQLPEIEKPTRGQHLWRYVGEHDGH